MRDATFTRIVDNTRRSQWTFPFRGHWQCPASSSSFSLPSLWITFHYITVWKRMRAGAASPGKVVIDRAELERMRELGERLDRRIASLETILDAEAPEWRDR